MDKLGFYIIWEHDLLVLFGIIILLAAIKILRP